MLWKHAWLTTNEIYTLCPLLWCTAAQYFLLGTYIHLLKINIAAQFEVEACEVKRSLNR